MTRRLLGMWLLTLPILPLFAASANASSITCYGSIVITTLGTEGMAITVPDGAIVQPTDPGAGSGFAVDAGSGVTIRPPTPKPMVNDAAPARSSGGSGGSGGSSGASGGVSSPAITAAHPASDDVNIINTPVPVPTPVIPITDVPTWPIDLPPGTPPKAPFTDPLTTTVGLPIEDVLIQTLGGGGSVSNTPEPATLTLLGLAGVGGWFRVRRRK